MLASVAGAVLGFVVGTAVVFAVLDAMGRGCEPIDQTGGPCPNAVGLFALIVGGLPGALVGGAAGLVATAGLLARRDSRAAGQRSA